MTATLLIGTFSILLAYLAKYENTRWALKGSFVIVFFFLALRYNLGNDYATYLNGFEGESDIALTMEPGWNYLSDAFRPLGFFAMVGFLALLTSIVYYHFIKRYVPPNLYWLAVCIYVMNPDFMLIHSSAMRQAVAIMLFVFAFDYLNRRALVHYMLCIALAALFHFSALILIPVYFVARPDWRLTTTTATALFTVYLGLFAFGSTLSGYLTQFIGAFFTRYAVYDDPGALGTGLGFVLLTGMFITTLYYAREQRGERALMFQIASISFLLAPLTLLIDLSARIGMYFAPATLVTYPVIFTCLKQSVSKAVYMSVLLAFVAFKFLTFFGSDTWREYFGTYYTIFSATRWH